MAYAITLPENYGYPLLVAVGLFPVLAFGHGMLGARHRPGSGVDYPIPMATDEQAKQNPKAHRFNLAQRSHANLMENYTQATLSILVAGLKYPTLAGHLGLLWAASRVLYSYGYTFGTKAKGMGRVPGFAIGMLTQGFLWGMAAFGVAWELVQF